jgi:hypothetical protein
MQRFRSPKTLQKFSSVHAQVHMAYGVVTTDTVATLLGRPPIKLEAWSRQHRSDLGT